MPPSVHPNASCGSGKWNGAVRSRAASWLAATRATTAPAVGAASVRLERSGGPAERVDAPSAGVVAHPQTLEGRLMAWSTAKPQTAIEELVRIADQA